MNELKDFVGIAGAPFVVALTEAVKVTFPDIPSRWYPSIAVLWGLILNIGIALVIQSNMPVAIVIGVATGLLASGLFAWGKRTEI